MRIAVATVQVPFIRGGAEVMTNGLSRALREEGHSVDVVSLPFRFSPLAAVSASIDAWQAQDFDSFDVGKVDRVIALKFPAYNLNHPTKVVWLMHQHRAVYELMDTPYGESSTSRDAVSLREKVKDTDTKALQDSHAVFTISRTVSERLLRNNQVKSKALYQPPPAAEAFRPGPIYPYIYFPSRLENVKRQDLFIRSMQFVNEPLIAVIAGEGGAYPQYVDLVKSLGLQKRIRFIGCVDDTTMRNYYSNALAVCFCPFEEDYGFITLEAMLSAKPVITCADSGGPTEFVVDKETGFVLPPEPKAIADTINQLWADRTGAARIGQNGLQHYLAMDITWSNVVQTLLGT